MRRALLAMDRRVRLRTRTDTTAIGVEGGVRRGVRAIREETRMLTRLLVGLDGSDDAAAALDLALEWGGRSKALVGGIAVVDEPGIRAPEAVPLGAGAFKEARDEARMEETRAQVEGWLDAFQKRCGEAGVTAGP